MLLKVGLKDNERGNPLYLDRSDLKAHAHGIGASRAGKSKLIEFIARQFIKDRQGFCVIDPGGFLYEDLVQYLAYSKPTRSKIVLLNPSYDKKVVGFNPLRIEGTKSETTISAKVDRMVALTTKALGISDLTNAPRLERIMRCLYYVLIEQDLSLEAVRYFLSPRHIHVRDAIIGRIRSETIKDQWLMLTQGKRPEAYMNLVESTANRLFKVLTQPAVKRIIGVPENSIDIRSITENRGALIVNLQQGEAFSNDAAHMIGTFLVNEIWESVRRRTREEMRRMPPFFLLVDEFQSFATPDFAQILDQGAKYGLHLLLFHQNLNQLDAQIRTAMTACHSRFVFGGVTTADARQMLEGYAEDTSLIPRLPQRYYALRRPDRPLVLAYTPEVHEYRVREERLADYIQSSTDGFLSPEEIDALMAKSMPIVETPTPEVEQAPEVDLGDLLRPPTASRPYEPPKPKASRKPPPFELTYDRARGTETHRGTQRQIANVARDLKFSVHTEKSVLDGAGSVDVSLARDGIKIACEVSITSTAAWEAKNVRKCLQAGYDRVWVIAFPKNVDGLTRRISETIPVIDQAKFKVLTLGDCFVELRKLAAPIDPKTGKPAKLAGQMLDVSETAAYFHVNKSTIYRWVAEGILPRPKLGRKLLFDRDLLELLSRHNLTGKQRIKVELDQAIKIEKTKPKSKKQQDDRYRKMLNLD